MPGAPLDHRLIMFVGPSGAGKSTLSSWLYQRIAERRIPATLLPEHEVYQLGALQAFVGEWNRCHPQGITTLLDAVRTLGAEWNASDTVWITDTFLPAFHWLHGKYAPEQVQAYAEALDSILQPLQPMLVYLEADVYQGWQRAVEERGQSWSDWMVEIFKNREFPEYPGGPIQNLGDLLQYFAWSQTQSLALLAHWPGKTLMLRTTTTPRNQLQETLLQHVGLDELSCSCRDER